MRKEEGSGREGEREVKNGEKEGLGSHTSMERHVVVMEEHDEEVGKSRGRTGSESNESSGFSPPCDTNSLMWSSVELLLRMASTKCTCKTQAHASSVV